MLIFSIYIPVAMDWLLLDQCSYWKWLKRSDKICKKCLRVSDSCGSSHNWKGCYQERRDNIDVSRTNCILVSGRGICCLLMQGKKPQTWVQSSCWEAQKALELGRQNLELNFAMRLRIEEPRKRGTKKLIH